MNALRLVAVAVAAPLYRCFDYLAPEAMSDRLRPGVRVRVPFGRRQLVGMVMEPPRQAPHGGFRYRPPSAVLDETPLLPAETLALLRWAAHYYQHPIGEVVTAALPALLRRGGAARLPGESWAELTPLGRTAEPPVRAHRLRHLLAALADGPQPLETLERGTFKRALEQAWVVVRPAPAAARAPAADAPAPSEAQTRVLAALRTDAGFRAQLLQGVTGSGKTEIYLRRSAEILGAGRQVLVLTPEIGLTPQLLIRFEARFPGRVAGYHSGMSEGQRARAWLKARNGDAAILIGTRSAALLPFARLGLVVVDEEHDVSLKQQDGFRYSARDLAIYRARRLGIPVLLGSATPSLESLANARAGRYHHLHLPLRVRQTAPPRIELLDARGQRLDHGLTSRLLDTAGRHLDRGGQVLLFINRRGYAPALLCRDCGWVAPCRRCDARMTLHRRRGRLICHHCAAEAAIPEQCGRCGARALAAVGQGTERVEEALRLRFPGRRIERIDSDRVGRAGELERLLGASARGEVDILVGTQMLAKGHDFPGLSMVGIVNVDQALYGADFRALERMGQLVVQVAGRAGRADTPGEVLLQTHEPQHPLLRLLVESGYEAFADALLRERREAGWPPASYLALLRAEALQSDSAFEFLAAARGRLPADAGVQVLGPVPAPMERRGGRWRAQLLLQSRARASLQRALAAWVPQLPDLPEARRVRWSIDVDPVDLY